MVKAKFQTVGIAKAPNFMLVLDSCDICTFNELMNEAQRNINTNGSQDINEVKIVVEIESTGILITPKGLPDFSALVIEKINHIGDMGVIE